MTADPEAISTLTQLGLTPAQARVYLALVHLGALTIKKTAAVTGVARQDTYRIMNGLQELGLVERVITSPMMFKATPIVEALPLLIRRKIDETSELQKKVQKLIHAFQTIEAQRVHKEYNLDSISKRAKELLIEKARSVKSTLDIMNTWNNYVKLAAEYLKSVDRASKLSVCVRLITNEPDKKQTLPRIVKNLHSQLNIQLRFCQELPPVSLMICDKKDVFIAVNSPSFEVGPALWSRNPCITVIAQDYFNKIWFASKEGNLEKYILPNN